MFQHSLSTASTTLVGRGEANVNLRPETPGKRRQVGTDVRVALQCGIVLPSGNQGREGYVYTLCLFCLFCLFCIFGGRAKEEKGSPTTAARHREKPLYEDNHLHRA